MERKGICRNVGACSMANKVQIITDDDAELKCCECESELEPVKIDERTSNEEEEKAKKRKRLISIFAIIAILAAVGVGLYLLWPNESKEKPQFTLNHFEKTLKIGETDTLKATVSPEGIQATIVWKASKDGTVEVQNGIVKAVKGGSGKVRVQAIIGKDTLSAICKYTVDAIEMQPEPPQPDPKVEEEEAKAKTQPQPTPTPPESGSLKLSYGKYTGQMKNGYPNGQGRLVYSTSRQISQYDSKGRIAQAGESVQGNFKNGFFTFGKHYDANGNLIESLNIGAPTEGVFESK